MEVFFRILLFPLTPIIEQPERAFFVAVGFGVFAVICILYSGNVKRFSHFFILCTTLLWVLFGLHEMQAKAAGWNIRVDLLITWPILLLASIASAVLGLSNFREGQAHDTPEPKD